MGWVREAGAVNRTGEGVGTARGTGLVYLEISCCILLPFHSIKKSNTSNILCLHALLLAPHDNVAPILLLDGWTVSSSLKGMPVKAEWDNHSLALAALRAVIIARHEYRRQRSSWITWLYSPSVYRCRWRSSVRCPRISRTWSTPSTMNLFDARHQRLKQTFLRKQEYTSCPPHINREWCCGLSLYVGCVNI